ncbi:unnamed protein product [Lampetra fluviatilis]
MPRERVCAAGPFPNAASVVVIGDTPAGDRPVAGASAGRGVVAEPLVLPGGQRDILVAQCIDLRCAGPPTVQHAYHNPSSLPGVIGWRSWGRVCQDGAGRKHDVRSP